MKGKIKEYLGCDDAKAAYIETKLLQIDDSLKPMLAKWLQNDEVSGDEVFHGYSIHMLMGTYRMKFTGAILTLDWIIKDPASAEKALKYGIR